MRVATETHCPYCSLQCGMRLSGRRTQVVTETGFTTFFRGDILGIPVLIWLLAAVFAVGWVLLNRTTFGRRTIAVGGNPEAARLAYGAGGALGSPPIGAYRLRSPKISIDSAAMARKWVRFWNSRGRSAAR